MPNSPEGYTFLIVISILLTTYLGYKFHQNRHSIFKYGKRLGFIVIGFWILYTILNVRSQSLENHQLIGRIAELERSAKELEKLEGTQVRCM